LASSKDAGRKIKSIKVSQTRRSATFFKMYRTKDSRGGRKYTNGIIWEIDLVEAEDVLKGGNNEWEGKPRSQRNLGDWKFKGDNGIRGK